MIRRPFFLFFSVLPSILLVCMLMAACSASQRQDTIRTTLVGLNSARDGFLTWDLAHQTAIKDQATTRTEYDTAITAYRSGPQSKILNGMTLAYKGLAVAATQTDQPSLDAALAQAASLLADIKALMGGK